MKEKIKAQLMAELSRKNRDLVVQFVIDNPQAIQAIVDLIQSNEQKVSMRAAWVLEQFAENKKLSFDEYIDVLVNVLLTTEHSSSRRILAKIIMLNKIPEAFEGEMLDFCICVLESAKEPVAVKANCMTIVFNLLPKYPDLKNEVYAVIESQFDNNSVGFKSRFMVLKRKLKV